MKRVIGLVGFKGSGKDTAADVFVSRGFQKDSFAAPLKDAVAQIFSWDREMLEGTTTESRAWREIPDPYWSKVFGYDVMPRMVLQKFGTESVRDVFHDDIWVKSLVRRIETSPHHKFVVSDVRFQNEVRAIQELGGIIIRVRRGGEPNWFLTAEQANRGHQDAIRYMIDFGIHRSEWDWIGCGFDYVIENDGTIEELKQKVLKIVDKHTVLV
jgi:hypothetical protein